ncbi:DeoR/GlpR family DNA-binding transcription regulator [Paenibacillus turpanensis]|uniref:DeoR/GlpR family DNA-binding transcription regulator n=1 Tax=Paenibacillus turpanensis TaxID=2689078 RepID=UPI00140DE909|nr:DeoR/GlpR family DNA-binding transcription regulator [Paenibacillus turpanensis]
MLAAERWHKIVEIVNERGSIRVTELSELCGVTEETIRRDLDRLEAEGKLMRSHGGAVCLKDNQPELSYTIREATNLTEKQRIAREAARLVEPNDRIILDASSTAWCMAAILPDIPLTVLTNSIRVALELSSKEKIQVISTGGIVSSRSLSFVGPLAERSLQQYHVDKAFISCRGIHPERGISDSNELQGRIKQQMIAIADRVILLADFSKFGVQAFAQVADWEQIDTVVTDEQMDRMFTENIRELIIAR